MWWIELTLAVMAASWWSYHRGYRRGLSSGLELFDDTYLAMIEHWRPYCPLPHQPSSLTSTIERVGSASVFLSEQTPGLPGAAPLLIGTDNPYSDGAISGRNAAVATVMCREIGIDVDLDPQKCQVLTNIGT